MVGTAGRSAPKVLCSFSARSESSLSPYINQFLSADTIVPNPADQQSTNRYSYVQNNPIRYTDPTGHLSCDDVDDSGHCINYEQLNRRKNRKLQDELRRFKKISTYSQSEMIIIEFSDYQSVVTPEEFGLLQNEKGTLDTPMYYRMAGVTLAALKTAQNLFPDHPGDNSPRNAFQHAYWNALMVQEFGGEFTEKFATAHEKGAGSIRESQFMDLHNNAVGRNIGTENSTAPSYVLVAQVLQATQNGELYVWDGNEIFFSNQCPLCTFP